MTSGRGKAVQFKGVGASPEETSRNIQEAVDQLAGLIPEAPGTPEEEVVNQEVPRLVRVTAKRPDGFDIGARFLRCTSQAAPSGSGPITYEFFRDGLKLASSIDLPIGSQFVCQATINNAGAGIAVVLSCNVFKAVVYDIPWSGDGPPSSFSGPMAVVDEAGGHCTVDDEQYDGASPSGTRAWMGATDEWGNPQGFSGTCTWNGSNVVQQVKDMETCGLEWTVTPFFFYDGMEEECKSFLQGLFGGGGTGSGADSITTGQAKRCLTTSDRFAAVVVARRFLASGARSSMNGGFVDVNSLTDNDADRARWTVKIHGHQRVVVK